MKKKLIRICNSVGRYVEFHKDGSILCADYDFGCDKREYNDISDAIKSESKYIKKKRNVK